PQHTVTFFSGSTSIPCHVLAWRAIACRRFLAPQVMAYWLTSFSMACWAARLSSAGAAKSGKPCARFIAPWSCAWRVISRITDSVKRSAFSLTRRFAGRGVMLAACSLPAVRVRLAAVFSRADFTFAAPAAPLRPAVLVACDFPEPFFAIELLSRPILLDCTPEGLA